MFTASDESLDNAKTYAQIVDGKVINRAEFDGDMPADWPDRDTWHVATDDMQIGASWDGETYAMPPPEPKAQPVPQDVKEEAGRRILYRFPDWKQRNMMARSIELQDIASERPWTTEETAEVVAFRAAWAWIQSVRDASDTIEAIDPIPADFADNTYWPA